MNSNYSLKIAKNGSILIFMLYCILGLWLLFHPSEDLGNVYLLISLLLLASGTLRIIGYFSKDFYCLAFQFDLALGIFSIIAGLCLFTRRQLFYANPSFLFGLLVMNDALFKVQTSLDAKRFGLKTLWWVILLAALATGAGGLFLLFLPMASSCARWTIAGFAVLADGILNLLVIFFTVKIRPQDPAS